MKDYYYYDSYETSENLFQKLLIKHGCLLLHLHNAI